MDALLKKFVALVEEETHLYGELLVTLQQEKQAVVYSRLKELSKSSKQKESIILKIRILEEHRITLLKKLADLLGCPSQEITLTQLSELIPEPYSKRLKECCSNLLALLQSIQEINQSNKTLLTYSIELVRGSLTLLHNLMISSPVYHRTGAMQAGEHGGNMLSGKI